MIKVDKFRKSTNVEDCTDSAKPRGMPVPDLVNDWKNIEKTQESELAHDAGSDDIPAMAERERQREAAIREKNRELSDDSLPPITAPEQDSENEG